LTKVMSRMSDGILSSNNKIITSSQGQLNNTLSY